MTAALASRRMLLGCLLAAALLFAGAGHAAAAQLSPVVHGTAVFHRRPVAYADGSLTLGSHSRRKVPVARLRVRTAAKSRPLAYADGLLTGAHHRSRSRHLVRRTA